MTAGAGGGRGRGRGRGKKSGGGRGGFSFSLIPRSWIGWVVIVVVLVLLGNLVAASLGLFTGDEPSGFITPERVLALATWIPICIAMLFGFLGAMWATLGARVRRRQGLPYYRWAFMLGMLGVFGFTLAAFESTTFTRQRLIPVALVVMAVQTMIFAIGVRADLARKPSPRRDE